MSAEASVRTVDGKIFPSDVKENRPERPVSWRVVLGEPTLDGARTTTAEGAAQENLHWRICLKVLVRCVVCVGEWRVIDDWNGF